MAILGSTEAILRRFHGRPILVDVTFRGGDRYRPGLW